MSLIITILEKAFTIIILFVFLVWLVARIKGKTFWQLYNDMCDSIFGKTEEFKLKNDFSLKNIIGNTGSGSARFSDVKRLTNSQKSKLKKLVGG